jgi:cold shock protein
MAVQQSIVKWFDGKKGFGFITHPAGESDIFVHYSVIDTSQRFKSLRTGQHVAFEIVDGPKGLHARNVMPLDLPDEVIQPEPPAERKFRRGRSDRRRPARQTA